LADPLRRQRFIEIDDDPEGFPRGHHLHDIAEVEIRIHDRVEALAVLLLFRIMHPDADRLCCTVDLARSHDGCWLPLTGRWLEAQVTVGGDTQAVLNDADAALVALRIIIVSEHHVEPGHLEILQLVEPKLIVGRRERGSENKTQGWEGDQPVHLNAGARVFTAPTAKKREAQSSATNGRPEDRVAGRTGGEPWRVIAEART